MNLSRTGRLDYRIEQNRVFDVTVTTQNRFTVAVDPEGLGRLSHYVLEAAEANDCMALFIVLDDNVRQAYLDVIESELAATRLRATFYPVEAREAAKSIQAAAELWNALNAAGVARRTMVIAIGGGIVSDLAGFAAQTYLRGLPFALVPTTLLAQIDAAIGGKNGVTHLGKKNRLGGFHQPVFTLIDPTLLRTLPRSVMAEGFAEAVKIAALTSAKLMVDLRAISSSLHWASSPILSRIVLNSVQRKLELLASDPHEVRSLDRALNFGHCIGHPLEEALEYGIGHGSAVSAGMSVAARIGLERGITPQFQQEEICALLAQFGLPTTIASKLRRGVWEALGSVRDVRNGQLRMVIPAAPGEWEIVPEITYDEWERACDSD